MRQYMLSSCRQSKPKHPHCLACRFLSSCEALNGRGGCTWEYGNRCEHCDGDNLRHLAVLGRSVRIRVARRQHELQGHHACGEEHACPLHGTAIERQGGARASRRRRRGGGATERSRRWAWWPSGLRACGAGVVAEGVAQFRAESDGAATLAEGIPSKACPSRGGGRPPEPIRNEVRRPTAAAESRVRRAAAAMRRRLA